MIVLSFMYREVEQPISRGWLLIYFSLSVLTVISYRFVFRRLVYRLRQRGLFLKRSLIVGANQEGQAMIEQFRCVPTAGVHVVGFVDDTLTQGTVVNGLPVLGNSKSLKTLVEEQGIDELIVSPTSLWLPIPSFLCPLFPLSHPEFVEGLGEGGGGEGHCFSSPSRVRPVFSAPTPLTFCPIELRI